MDLFFTILIILGALAFLGYRFVRFFTGKSSPCACTPTTTPSHCSGGCSGCPAACMSKEHSENKKEF